MENLHTVYRYEGVKDLTRMVYVYTNISLPYSTCNLFVLRNDSTSRLTGHTIASALQFPSADQFGRSVLKEDLIFFPYVVLHVYVREN